MHLLNLHSCFIQILLLIIRISLQKCLIAFALRLFCRKFLRDRLYRISGFFGLSLCFREFRSLLARDSLYWTICWFAS